MKLTLQDHIDDFRTAVGDDNFSETIIIRYLNKAQDNIAKKLNCQVSIKRSLSTVAYQEEYTIPSRIRRVTNVRVESDTVGSVTKEFMEQIDEQSRDNTGMVDNYWRDGNKLGLYYRPDAAAESTTLSGAISSATAISIVLAYNATLPDRGCGIVDSEVIWWTNKTNSGTSTSTLSGCTRGAEGTVATTHSDGTTFTWRDIEIFGFAYPSKFINRPAQGTITTQTGVALDVSSKYTYKLTFYSSSLEKESLSYLIGSITPTVLAGLGALSSLPISSDSNIDYKRIYRTEGGGSLYYYVGAITNTTTTYTDSNTDATIMANSLYSEPYSEIDEEYHEAITIFGLSKYFEDTEEYTRAAIFKNDLDRIMGEGLFDEYNKRTIHYPQRPLPE